jgi:3-dehydroquinate synthase
MHRFQPAPQSVLRGLLNSYRSENIVLIGFMGVGKTEIGRLCATELGFEFCDTDAIVEIFTGRTIAQIFAVEGEQEFRRLERLAISEAVLRRGAVIATGGGAPLDPINQSKLKSAGTVVLLTEDAAVISHRIGDPSSRPLLIDALDTDTRIEWLLGQRHSAYHAAADKVIAVQSREPLVVAQEVIKQAAEASVRIRETLKSSFRLDVKSEVKGYPIWLGTNLIRNGGGIIIAEAVGETRACIVTHPHLKRRYADPIAAQMMKSGVECTIELVPQGESRKNLRTIERLYRSFAAAGLDRNSLVVAVGGGVIGDIAGFAAACYLRGIRCAQVPTTLLAQVDSSVGGKTGVDLPEGKNLVGAFHPPTVVVIDPEALRTLPVRELRSGLAEVIKYGIITDKSFFYQTQDDLPAMLNREMGPLTQAIKRSCEIKASVVSEDEKEQGLRAILNFGHTVGHALESVTQYRQYRHGEAIAIGMVSACLIGEDLGITPPSVTTEVSDCLSAAGLPFAFPASIDMAMIHAAMALDKKALSGRLRFVIAEEIGKVRIVDGVSRDVIDSAIARQKLS